MGWRKHLKKKVKKKKGGEEKWLFCLACYNSKYVHLKKLNIF